MQGNYKLSMCIPNYGRLMELERLLRFTSDMIVKSALEDKVEICISDDFSKEDPCEMVRVIRSDYPEVNIVFQRNKQNMGMDYNFLRSVMMAQGEYCWLIGNDDLPTDTSLSDIVEIICSEKYADIDFLVTPYDSFCEKEYRLTTYPFGDGLSEEVFWDTSKKEQLHDLIMRVKRNSALFDFLSNVVFRRERWVKHGDKFRDKMDTIFIQVYMNMQTLIEGAKYLYLPRKIICNYVDDETNNTFDRTFRIVVGLYDVYAYFLKGEEKEHIISTVVEMFVSGLAFEGGTDEQRNRLYHCDSKKIKAMAQYYIPKRFRNEYFNQKSVVIYGAGKIGAMVYEELKGYDSNLLGVCDADKNKQGTFLGTSRIFDFATLLEVCKQNKEVTVVVANYHSIVQIVDMLDQYGIKNIAIAI